MKRLLLTTLLVAANLLNLAAQKNNAILFTENGERFQVILNGILQNANPETNVKMTDLVAPNYKCRILFADTKLGYIDFNLYFQEQGEEVTWNIKKNNKGEYVTRFVSSVPIAQAPPAPATQTVVVYTAVPAVAVAPAPVATGTTTTSTTVQHSQTTTSTSNGMPATDGENVNINMGINVGDQGGSISINASGMNMGMDVQESSSSVSSTTTTTTTTHSTTTTSSGVGIAPPPPSAPAPVVYVTGYNGAVGCPVPMSPGDFSSFKQTVTSKDFEETKLTIAKQVLQNNCLTSAQVKEVMQTFDFEATKLEFAKYAYAHTYDIGNYYKVNDAFEFESSVDELNRYISR